MGSEKLSVQPVTPLPLDTPVYDDRVRFVCMSDTHSNAAYFTNILPPGDVFLHAGDFTYLGLPEEVEAFNAFLGTLPYKHKIVVAGNHELSFDDNILQQDELSFDDEMMQGNSVVRVKFDRNAVHEYLRRNGLMEMKQVLVNCRYLEDSETAVFGLRVYGSPWHPEFDDWAFNLPTGSSVCDKWKLIPDGIDVLITHGPPRGHGDLSCHGLHSGCDELLSSVQHRVRPKFHVFGHIHEGFGVTTDGVTTFINASSLNVHYKPVNKPVIFDLPLPPGVTKH